MQQSQRIDEVIVATTFEKKRWRSLNDTRVFAGSHDDILDRFYPVTKLPNPKYDIYLTADCPLSDAQLLDQSIKKKQRAYT